MKKNVGFHQFHDEKDGFDNKMFEEEEFGLSKENVLKCDC